MGMPLNRFYLSKKRIEYQIPPTEKIRKAGRPKLFNEEEYHSKRPSIERFFSWIKTLRRIIIKVR